MSDQDSSAFRETQALRAEVADLRSRLGDLDRTSSAEAVGPPASLDARLLETASALAFSEARHRAILDSSTDFAIIVTDLEGRVTSWNAGAVRIFGWTEAEALGQPAEMIFTPEDRAHRQPALEMEAALASGCGVDERPHVRKDGARFWASGSLMPLRVDGRVEGFLKILRDRTREQEAETQRRQAEERLQAALSASGMVGVWDWDLRTGLVYADTNFAKMCTLDPAGTSAGFRVAEFTRTLHPDDLPVYQQALERTLEGGEPFAAEYRIRQSDGSIRWVLGRGALVSEGADEAVRIAGAIIDITARKQAEARQAALVELGDRFRDLVEPRDMAFAAAEIIGRTLGLTRSGYGSLDARGDCITIERDWTADGAPSLAGQHRLSEFGAVGDQLRNGETVIVDDVRLDPRTAGRAASFRRICVRAMLNAPVMEGGRLVALLFLHDANVRHWSPEKLAFVRDMAQRTRDAVERRRAEEHERLLAHELQHRVKNTLAMVQAIASQTFRSESTPATRETFSKRLVALSQANDVLTKAGWTAASIADVVQGATVPHCAGPERFTFTGPQIEIAARAALALTLALHELCTNASKYGALSNEAGHVTVAWEVSDDDLLRLRWAERGGPAVAKPTRTGFGTQLIERSLGPQLGGFVRTDFEAEGLTCSFEVPLAKIQEPAAMA